MPKTLDYFTTQRLGAKRALTPEGFLLCEAVPIARTGTMVYGEHEVPVPAGRDGLVYVERGADDVFRAETMASFEGKPVTLDHPDEFVGPGNWGALSKGVVQNVRRGVGIEDDLLLADLLITDATAIDQVMRGMREVSCGYEAEYDTIEPGRGAQRTIIGNHVALVERGRCGTRCAIGDKETTTMSKKTPRTWMDRIRTAFKAQDAAALDAELEAAKKEMEDGDDEDDDKSKTGDSNAALAIALDALTKTVKALDEKVDEMAKKKDEEEETTDTVIEAETAEQNKQAKGEVLTGDAWGDVIARAEILAPGIQVQTADSAKRTVDAACACQRAALVQAFATDAGRQAIEPFLSSKVADAAKHFAGLTADQLRAVFVGASEVIRARNNAGAVHARTGDSARTGDFGKAITPADINKANSKYWADRAAR